MRKPFNLNCMKRCVDKVSNASIDGKVENKTSNKFNID
jgi:hypothetical protein